METVQQNVRFTLFSSKFPSNIYSILYGYKEYKIKAIVTIVFCFFFQYVIFISDESQNNLINLRTLSTQVLEGLNV